MWYRHLDRGEKIILSIAYAFRLILVIAIAQQIFIQNWMLMFLTILTLILTFLPAIIEKNYRITIPVEFTVITTIFIYMSMFLGERGYYFRFDWWDKLLHGSSAIVLGFVGFLIVYEMNSRKKINVKPRTAAIMTFTFALALGAVWEIYEFSMDEIVHTNMQRKETGVVDTMEDIIVDAIGSLITAIAGFFYLKSGKAFFFDRALIRFVEKNPKIFRKIR